MIKGLLVETEVLDLRKGPVLERQLLFPDRNWLCISVNKQGDVFAARPVENISGRRTLEEVEVPDEIVYKAENLLMAEALMKCEYPSITRILYLS